MNNHGYIITNDDDDHMIWCYMIVIWFECFEFPHNKNREISFVLYTASFSDVLYNTFTLIFFLQIFNYLTKYMAIRMRFSWTEKFGPLLFRMTLSAILNGYETTVLTNNNNIETANKTATIYKIYYFLQKLFLPEL